jgi:hypothetical protein
MEMAEDGNRTALHDESQLVIGLPSKSAVRLVESVSV